MSSRTIEVNVLARVEGEGALYLKTEGERVVEAKLRIFEPPRFFEGFLRGRDFREAPDITARICGICPVAYQMGACHAMEEALGVQITPAIRELRRLLYCGEWIESHVLHIYMLHAPDFLGYDSAIAMAKDHRSIVERGLKMKKIGNEIMTLLGGREIHPINVKIGGFYKAPRKEEMQAMIAPLQWARDAAIETIRWTGTLAYPNFSQDYTFVALDHPSEYPLNEGRLISNRGLSIPIQEFFDHFDEHHVPHTNALQGALKDGSAYLVGPMARYALHFDQLTSTCQELAHEINLPREVNNPFQSIAVRSIEVLYAIEEALRILHAYEEPEEAAVPVEIKAGVGFGCTEAPRGICLHRYEIDHNGSILDATIVPPTSQNQRRIEEDLFAFAQSHLHLDDHALTWQCEQAIRNYDPCISCATHFLTLTRERI